MLGLKVLQEKSNIVAIGFDAVVGKREFEPEMVSVMSYKFGSESHAEKKKAPFCDAFSFTLLILVQGVDNET